MDCNESQKLMSAYLDEELDPSSAAKYAEHLLSCTACNSQYEELLRLGSTLKTHSTNYTAPSHLRYRIQADLDALKPRKKSSRKWSWAWINFGVASACSFAFALTMSLYLAVPSEADRLDQEIVASHYRSLLANHLADVASSDHHTVKPWFSGKLDYSPPVFDFVDQGFTLLGGRLDYVNQRSVAALAYRHDKHLINLFVWPDKSQNESPAKNTSMQGFHLLEWTHSGMAYRAISDMNAQELANFRALLISQIDKETKTP
ncbi:anti-sigma factor family protein [Solimicrobium silvestre]|uniref:Putative zinc-finger n=1 Tax=Solimicrobium silvestre TaxID=2099400 RepID=A0A2S9GSY8_9BURK|nr:anti-sigma factor [Solimicrobium silvestre]PRC90808.1 putative zinc-finger [Solimicrobium silvestre]